MPLWGREDRKISGGKGGSQSAKTEIPKWLEDQYKQVFARADQASQIGYQPYYGPTVAAFNPTQQQAMQNNIGAAQAFGMAPEGMQALAGMPQAQDFGNGVMGYSSAPLYEQALAEYRARMPGQAAQYDALYVNPQGAPAPQTYDAPQPDSAPQYSDTDKFQLWNLANRGALGMR